MNQLSLIPESNEPCQLFIDIGTTMGWALSTDPPRSGSENFSNRRFDGGGMRYLKFEQWLDVRYQTRAFDAVYFEEVRRHMGVDAAHVYGGFLACLSSWCEKRQIPYQGVSIGTYRKAVLGKGNAGKNDMLKHLRRMGFQPGCDNESDALGLMLYVRPELRP